jgi:hypothetical protein
MAKKNVTIVLDEELIERLRRLPQVLESSLSTDVAELLGRKTERETNDAQVLTVDLQHGQVIDGVEMCNPLIDGLEGA